NSSVQIPLPEPDVIHVDGSGPSGFLKLNIRDTGRIAQLCHGELVFYPFTFFQRDGDGSTSIEAHIDHFSSGSGSRKDGKSKFAIVAAVDIKIRWLKCAPAIAEGNFKGRFPIAYILCIGSIGSGAPSPVLRIVRKSVD